MKGFLMDFHFTAKGMLLDKFLSNFDPRLILIPECQRETPLPPNNFASVYLHRDGEFSKVTSFCRQRIVAPQKGYETQRIIFSFAFYLGRLEKCATEPLWNAGAQWVNTSVMSNSFCGKIIHRE